MIAPPRPLAEPARCGRTDSMPAVALGIDIPLPRPTKNMKPKKLAAEDAPASTTASEAAHPSVTQAVPQSTMALIPKRTEATPDRKLPRK